MTSQSLSNSRKRAAPGASPSVNMSGGSSGQNHSHNEFTGLNDPSQLSDDQFLSWSNALQHDNLNQFDQSAGTLADLSALHGGLGTGHPTAPSNQLVRRNTQQSLAARGRSFNSPSEVWGDFGGSSGIAPWNEPSLDDAELDRRAAEAKREAQAKRPPKQIPPFIQKLSSFLDNSNTELIRWSDDGNSFVVLDEDEFAKTLIPELFKHNNYASFVRQLNMYGFHKKVGLSDNSMRASEKKAKSPSEYYNPYFKRGRPELLWLIQKPKNEPPASKKKGAKKTEDDDEVPDKSQPKQSATAQELISLPKNQLVEYKQEIDQLRASQGQIRSMIARLQQENSNFIRQASEQQQRHENSINAILTFLATFYHRSGVDGNQQNLFTGAIPNNQPQGSVFDMGDYEEGQQNEQTSPAPRPMPRKTPLAIQAPPSWTAGQLGVDGESPTSRANSRRSGTSSRPPGSTSPLPDRAGSAPRSQRASTTPFKREQTGTPTLAQGGNKSNRSSAQPRQSQPPTPAVSNEDVLTAINNVNANTDINASDLDFSSALRQYENANGQGPLTPEQRDNMLSMLASNTGASNPQALQLGGGSGGKQAFSPSELLSLSNSANNSDYLDRFNNNQETIDMLSRLQAEQDSKVQDLAGRLQPLSPSGSIPGLETSMGNPGEFDIDSYLESDALNDLGDGSSYFPPDASAANFGNTNGFDGWDSGLDGLHNTNDAVDAPSLFQEAGDESAAAKDDGTGKILGSVNSGSSAGDTPTASASASAVEDEDDSERRAKRRRTGR